MNTPRLTRIGFTSKSLPALIIITALALLTILLGNHLQTRAADARDAEVMIAQLSSTLKAAQTPASGDVSTTLTENSDSMASAEQTFNETLSRLRRIYDTPNLLVMERDFKAENTASKAMLGEFAAATRSGRTVKVDGSNEGTLNAFLTQSRKLDETLQRTSADYRDRASTAVAQARLGSAAMVLLLLVAFAVFLRRSVTARARAEFLSHEIKRLLAASRVEALTDALTGMPNRRALMNDLETAGRDTANGESVLAIYDLDGFKSYNDTFGHPAGDALLKRLGKELTESVAGSGTAYRMGGDEFCVLAHTPHGEGHALAGRAAEALVERGDGFEIESSFGAALIPVETTDTEEALKLADSRLYQLKSVHQRSRVRSGDDLDLLLNVIHEQDGELVNHLNGVAVLAASTARAMGLDEDEVERVRIAAELHDIGKIAIPDSILTKDGPLDDEEWSLIRSHTVVGERIVSAVPSLAYTAELVRSCHERVDGNGYPDGLSGDEIPVGAKIIFVCDAFDAMVTTRPYRSAVTVAEAIAEIRKCAGSQFDETVSEQLIATVESNAAVTIAA